MIRLFRAFLLLLITGLPASGYAAETIDREYLLKSAYLYNIFKFISWPNLDTSVDEELELCILGPDFSNGSLFELNNKRIDNITIKVRHTDHHSQFDSCRAIYFTGENLDTRLEPLVTKGILLIGEHANFMAQGGTLNFFIDNNKLRFEINLRIATQSGIKFSSKLLRLARIHEK